MTKQQFDDAKRLTEQIKKREDYLEAIKWALTNYNEHDHIFININIRDEQTESDSTITILDPEHLLNNEIEHVKKQIEQLKTDFDAL